MKIFFDDSSQFITNLFNSFAIYGNISKNDSLNLILFNLKINVHSLRINGIYSKVVTNRCSNLHTTYIKCCSVTFVVILQLKKIIHRQHNPKGNIKEFEGIIGLFMDLRGLKLLYILQHMDIKIIENFKLSISWLKGYVFLDWVILYQS